MKKYTGVKSTILLLLKKKGNYAVLHWDMNKYRVFDKNRNPLANVSKREFDKLIQDKKIAKVIKEFNGVKIDTYLLTDNLL